MIHGLVDRPLTFTMADLKRFPSVTRLHFIECSGNRHNARHKNVQESHGMTSNAEWTGVLLSTLLKECGLKGKATWFVAEGAEEVKGASSMPIAKAMDDCLDRLRHERRALAAAARVSGAPHRPRLRGYLQHQVAAAHQGRRPVSLNYNDFGHLRRDAKEAALGYQIGPKSVITYPSGGQKLPGRGLYEITGLAWSGGGAIRKVEVSTDGGKKWNLAELKATPQRMAHIQVRLSVELGWKRDR